MNIDYIDDLKNLCHVNSNFEDTFVGLKMEKGNLKICFPLGYDLPLKNKNIREDIRILIDVIKYNSKNDERVIPSRFSDKKSNIEFPISAYQNVIEYFMSNNGEYYKEKYFHYSRSSSGKKSWKKTLKNKMPIIQQYNGNNNMIFTEFIVKKYSDNDKEIITEINKYCVYEAFKKLGWLYVDFIPQSTTINLDTKMCISIIQNKLENIYNDKHRLLFNSMIEMLLFLGNNDENNEILFGVNDFSLIWERLIDIAFGIKNKQEYFPRSRWILKYNKEKVKRPLMPDTIMKYDDNIFILDAKFYKYGNTLNAEHLPNGSSINKQITYGEYLEKFKMINSKKLFNAFLMPFNSNNNFFKVNSILVNIGEAVGDWRKNDKNYERIQGVMLDTKYLMKNYTKNMDYTKKLLGNIIQKSFE